MKRLDDCLVKLVNLLNDKQCHDLESLRFELGIESSMILQMIQKLVAYNIPIKLTEKGYFLTEPLILLSQAKIENLLKNNIVQVEVFEQIDSTNEYLKQLKSKKLIVCIAETQTQGRGRLGRNWHSPFGQNIYLSLLYPFRIQNIELSGLSLVVGLAVCKAMEISCEFPTPLFIKWPNDIMFNHKKISGNLIEIQSQNDGFCQIIIGVGININMRQASREQISQEWTSIYEITEKYQDRNQLCANLIQKLLLYVERFKNFGLKDFILEWQTRDYLFKRNIRLASNKTIFTGLGAGINEQGHLILEISPKIKRAFSSGEAILMK